MFKLYVSAMRKSVVPSIRPVNFQTLKRIFKQKSHPAKLFVNEIKHIIATAKTNFKVMIAFK